jgi:hypothetical protein
MVDDAAEAEALGGVVLEDDRDALSFGKGVVTDLLAGAGEQTGLTLTILEGDRIVGRIPVDRSD